jgi:hypothetical protein
LYVRAPFTQTYVAGRKVWRATLFGGPISAVEVYDFLTKRAGGSRGACRGVAEGDRYGFGQGGFHFLTLEQLEGLAEEQGEAWRKGVFDVGGKRENSDLDGWMFEMEQVQLGIKLLMQHATSLAV